MSIVQYVSWDVADPGLNLREIGNFSTQYLVALCWRGDQRFEFLSTTHRSCDTCDRITLWNSAWEMINDWDFLVPICTTHRSCDIITNYETIHQSWSYADAQIWYVCVVFYMFRYHLFWNLSPHRYFCLWKSRSLEQAMVQHLTWWVCTC